MCRFFLLFLALGSLFCFPGLSAAEVVDLGQGLGYLRVHSLASDEPAVRAAVNRIGALVLDLRYVTVDAAAVDSLKTVLNARSPGQPLFVLVSPATPTAVTPALAATSALVMGAPGSVPTPKVTVRVHPAADRRAFDALDAGTELSKLINGRIEKERFDEASLVQEFKNGNHDPAPPPQPNPTAPKTESSPPKETPAVIPTDRVLQRAVHLHRALAALKR